MEKDIYLQLHLIEDDTDTVVHAVLNIRGDHFEAMGRARRNPTDQSVPLIGEELSIARALQNLSVVVMDSAHRKVDEYLSS